MGQIAQQAWRDAQGQKAAYIMNSQRMVRTTSKNTAGKALEGSGGGGGQTRDIGDFRKKVAEE